MSSMRGDDALSSLMEEMSSNQGYGASTGGGGAASGGAHATNRERVRLVPEVEAYGRSDSSGNVLCPESEPDGPIWNPYMRVALGLGHDSSVSSRHFQSPPTNPEVELCRRRSYEKFKKGFYGIFKSVAENSMAAESDAKMNASKKGRSGGRDGQSGGIDEGRALSNTMWSELPSHAILERWHFASKLEEARAVRDRCTNGAAAVDERSRGEGGESNTAVVPTGRVREQLIAGRTKGVSMDPILVSPTAESGSGQGRKGSRRGPHDKNDGRGDRTTGQSENASSQLLRKEVIFQWKRERRRKAGVAGGASTKKVQELDEEFRCTFSAAKFSRRTGKLSREVRNLAQEIDADFLTELGRRAAQAALASASAEQQSHRKHGKKKDKSVPKISFRDDYDSSKSRDEGPPSSSVTVSVVYSGLSLRVNEAHYVKLQVLFDRFNKNSASLSSHRNAFASSLFSLLARYDMLEGAGLQSSLTGNVFDVLLTSFGCSMECFASPFNCRYERYCSAFPDTDGAFGSLGSFFDFDFVGAGGGAFQANPPFVADFIDRMYERMDDLLKPPSAKDDEVASKQPPNAPLMFIVFIPAWTETSGWSALNSSPHLSRHVLLSQKSDPHYYCEGTQHRRQKGRYRIASFDTSVFFLQNEEAKAKWPVTERIVEELRVAFSYNPEDDAGSTEPKEGAGIRSVAPTKAIAIAPDNTTTNPDLQSRSIAKVSAAPSKHVGKKRRQEEKAVKSKKGKKKQKVVADSKQGDEQQLGILASLGILDSGASAAAGKDKSSNQGRGGGKDKGKHAGKKKRRKGKGG